MTERFDTILVANRGEIASRIIRTARKEGYRTVAVASEADRHALHVKAADRVVMIGNGPAAQSYLNGDRIIEAARESGAGAIHPGYGFLSENAGFAKAVEEAGLVFIGPSPRAIALMGDKAAAKRAMLEAGVPCIPGYQGSDQSDERFFEAAGKAGYPIMLKAVAGGGGRGMRIVHEESALADALEAARAEADSAFGSSDLLLEKAVMAGRHVEIQVFGDRFGNAVHLGERDCSLQRRHQKVIEEAPSPAVNAGLRDRMGSAAVDAAKAVDYEGAGTVEFLLDQDGNFYFLEMNTRLQVEHPVTEEITGLDLVALQMRIARGEPLGFSQQDVRLEGHAVEARLYAEDPYQDYLPQTGPVKLFSPPQGIRTDAGIATGGEVTPFYDPMVAKLIAVGESREEARRKLASALRRTGALGFTTNRSFLIGLLEDPVFVAGEATTDHIDRQGTNPLGPLSAEVLALACAVQHRLAFDAAAGMRAIPEELAFWQSGPPLDFPYRYEADGETREITIRNAEDGFEIRTGAATMQVAELRLSGERGSAIVDGKLVPFTYAEDGPTIHLGLEERDVTLTNLLAAQALGAETRDEGAVVAPMHGLVTEVFCREGGKVEPGMRLMLLEAMKMQHEIKAPVAGTLSAVDAHPGKQVASGDTLAVIDPEKEKA